MPQRMQDATSSAPPTSHRERFQELDGLRGIAAVAVVWSHLTGNFDSKHPDAPAPFADIWWGVYGVQLFFLISGFVILMTAQRAQRPSDFVISRVSRLYPVYWIALTVSIIVSIAFAVPHTDVGWTARIMNYTMIQRLLLFDNVDEVYWTLAIEMQFYMLIFVLLLLTRCRLTDRRALLLAVVWGMFALVLAVVLGGHTRGVDPRFVVAPVKMALNLGMVLVFIAVTGIAVVYHRVGEVVLSRRFRTLLLAVRTRIDSRRRGADAGPAVA